MGIMSKSNIKINNSLINKHKYSSFSIFLFQFLIFLSLIHNSLSVTFSFPKAITLNNGNIFIIHKLGIDVYTSNLKTLIFNVKEFASSEQISNEQTLAKVIIKTFRDDEDDNNLIFCFIINKIYIFESNGAIFYEEASNSIISNFVGSYYDLSLVEKSGNKYYYIIGFVNSQSQAAFFRFEFDYDIKANTLKNTMSPFIIVSLYISSKNLKGIILILCSPFSMLCIPLKSIINFGSIACEVRPIIYKINISIIISFFLSLLSHFINLNLNT